MNTIQANIAEAKDALENKPLFATSVERILILNELKSSFKDLPQPLRFSKILSLLLSRVSTPVKAYDCIAGRCVDRELTKEEEEKFQEFIKSPDYTTETVFMLSGHCTFSWDMLLEYGLTGLKARALKSAETTKAADKKIFWTAMGEIYQAIIDYTLRYERAAREQGLYALAENLNTAATKKPDTFASALQLLWIVALINCAYIAENPTLTVGRLDKILYPFFAEDVRKGALTK